MSDKQFSDFRIFHQPKTAGTYCSACLSNERVLPHDKNYHSFVSQHNEVAHIKPVCIIRDPVDYYISLITFWCLDPSYAGHKFNLGYDKDKLIGHPGYWVSRGYTNRNFSDILNNFFDDEFIRNHRDKLSSRHHTYDNYVFRIMKELEIGYYTFGFLDQFSRKKIKDIKKDECEEEINYIINHFIILNTRTISKELKTLCEDFDVEYIESKKLKQSNRKDISCYDINQNLIDKIHYKDRYIYKILKHIKQNTMNNSL
tara:strand:+ start:2206 stop:2976 length:771 start_codon:yes stop_codon:yes gene_type:complete